MHDELINKFYTAFNQRDYTTMQSCYHPEATFSDTVFQNLDSVGVRAMWQMLLSSSKDIKVTFGNVRSDAETGRCRWEARYTFSQTDRKVHNIILARFRFKDGLIIEHHDYFNFWRWSAQAFGLSGLLLGWSRFLKQKVREAARQKLQSFRDKHKMG